jgi:4-hydroxybenzoate polyprenyltransferase
MALGKKSNPSAQTPIRQAPGNSRSLFPLIPFIRCLRPKQWTKNLLLFAAYLFSINKVDLSAGWMALLGFGLFCGVSGTVYILNDSLDAEQDKRHPEKRNRPIASGRISKSAALAGGAVLLIGCLIAAFAAEPSFGALLLGYFILNVAYSIRLKHVVIIDIMVIAAGFVLRAIGGGLIIHVPFTPWFLICTMLLALFLAVSKRRHEFMLVQNKQTSGRKVLQFYSAQLLDQLVGIVTTCTIMSYALFTFTSGSNIQMMWTIPLVVYGIFRYLYLMYIEDKGGSPDKVLLQDRPIQITVLLYAAAVFVILTRFG